MTSNIKIINPKPRRGVVCPKGNAAPSGLPYFSFLWVVCGSEEVGGGLGSQGLASEKSWRPLVTAFLGPRWA